MFSGKKSTSFILLNLLLVLCIFAAPKKSAAPKTIVDSFAELAPKILQTRADGKKASYAFVALSSDDGNAVAEDYVTDALTEAVFNTGKIKIFERANLEKILSEQKFQSSGLVDEDTAKDIGKIAGVDYICYGTLKNVGDSITVNVRVVDVQNGEICAMARSTVEKDTYLKNVKFEARKQSGGETSSSEKQNKNNNDNAITYEELKRRAEKSSWKVSKVRNDFDEETIYTFKCMNPDGTFLFFGYEKADKSINSRVRCSISQDFSGYLDDIEFKIDSGDIIKPNYSTNNWMYWDNKGGINYSKLSDSYEKIYKVDVATSKLLFAMFMTNNVIYIRDRKVVRPFSTEGLGEVMAMNLVSPEEILNAFANETF